jgi:hypothetical protein
MFDQAAAQRRLTELYDEHRRLDSMIADMASSAVIDAFSMQRFKKRKLQLKDEIHKLEGAILPDIIA